MWQQSLKVENIWNMHWIARRNSNISDIHQFKLLRLLQVIFVESDVGGQHPNEPYNIYAYVWRITIWRMYDVC